MIEVLLITGGVAMGAIISLVALKGRKLFDFNKRQEQASEILDEAKKEAEKISADVKDYVQKRKESIEQEVNKKRERLQKIEAVLANKESSVNKRAERNKEVELTLASLNEESQSRSQATKRLKKETLEKLTQKTGTTLEGLKEEILNKYKADLALENEEKQARQEEVLKENAEKIASKLVVAAIQRLSSPTSVETRAVTIKVPKDHIKGKIVGRGGQNILEIEKHIEVDIVFNDTPNTISVSAFQLVERRVAQITIEKLTKIHGEINKAKILETIKAARRETDDELYEIGKKALTKLNMMHDNKEFVRIVGRLQYRTSYGQNIMKHSIEIAHLATMLGSEIGLNVETCKIGGFLHDLGKAIDQDPNIDKPHDVLSKELMEKYGYNWEQVHAAWTHHDAIPIETAEALIVKAADAISASRPGARQESFERYLERIRALQGAAESFAGVKKAYAVSAGREIRVHVEPDEISDLDLKELAKKLASKIEAELTYPGQIRVNAIRRVKHTEIAK